MTDGPTDRPDRRLETWLASSPTRIAPPTRGVQACEPTTHTHAWDRRADMTHDRAGASVMPYSRSRVRSPLVTPLRFSDCTGPRRVDRRLTCSPWLPCGRLCVPETALTTSAIVSTVGVFGKNLVVRPVKNGDARLKHTATEKTAAVPVAEAESTKVLPRSALRHREDHSRAPPGI